MGGNITIKRVSSLLLMGILILAEVLMIVPNVMATAESSEDSETELNVGTLSAPLSGTPVSGITKPFSGGKYKSLTMISGWANVTGATISKVEITIRRNIDAKFWTGSTWGTSTWLLAGGTTSWSYNAATVTWTSSNNYTVQSRATDSKSNVEVVTNGTTFLFDSSKPTSSISVPVNNSVQATLNAIKGSASDTGGAGVYYVEILLKRTNDNLYWSGFNWSSPKTWLRTVGTTSWSYSTGASMWTVGAKYIVQSRATDGANNQEGFSGDTIFYIQVKNLTSTINTPVNNTYQNQLNKISGIASTAKGTLTKVEVNVKCTTDIKHWSGSAWTSTVTWLTATGTTSWSYNSASVTWNSNKNYRIQSRATNSTSHVESPSYGNVFTFDNIKPSSSITSPLNNSKLTILNKITGTASDTGGSGLWRVKISIERNDGAYFTGSYWTMNETWLLVSGTTSWTYNIYSNKTWLPGTYIIKSKAVDYANNVEDPSFGNKFTIPGTLASTILSPGNNTYWRILTLISGSATTTTGTNLSKVEISIKRNSDTKYWTGSAWTSGPTWLLTSGKSSWSYNSASVTWASGFKYHIRSKATDDKSNVETPSYGNVFTFDNNKPKSKVTSPGNNTTVTSLAKISGSASDTGGSGVSYVRISIKRYSDGWYWTGGNWTNRELWLGAAGTTSWNYYLNMSWSSGKYHVQSKATDKAGNTESPSFGNIFYIGTSSSTKPSSAISSPAHSSYLNSVGTISGTATDNTGSGLKSVGISIQRLNDYNYWHGSQWKVNKTWLSATGTTSWSFNASGVSWSTDIDYKIRSRAIDNKNNVEDPGFGINFMFDNMAPINVGISINKGDKYTKSRDVELKLQATDSGSGISEKAFSTDNGITWSSWERYNSTISFRLPKGDGEKAVFFKVKDRANNIAMANDTIILDSKAPMFISIMVNKDIIYTKTREIEIVIEINEVTSNIAKIAFGDDGILWTDWIEVQLTNPKADSQFITAQYTLPSGDGQKTIYYKIQDSAGNTVDYIFDNIILDTVPPEELSVQINDNSEFTNSEEVTLSVHAKDLLSGIYEMSFSTDDATWSAWEPFNPEKSYTLPTTDGEKIVYIRVNDKANNIKHASDDIILDTSPPHSLTIIINDGDLETDSTTVSLNLNAIDDTSGIGSMVFSNDDITWAAWEPFKNEISYNLPPNDGEKTIYFSVMDRAGNIATAVTASITLITTGPTKDTDNDGHPDNIDAFPDDPAAAVDSDGDHSPDYWNEGKSEADSTTGLYLDAFPDDPAASFDSDGDEYPDFWNDGMSKSDSTTGLELDAYPDDAKRYKETVAFGKANLTFFLILVIIVISIIVVLGSAFAMKNRRRHMEQSSANGDKIIEEIRNEILHGTLSEDSILTDDDIIERVEEKYSRGEISENAYYSIRYNK